jgi:hypothetical protein
VKRGITEPEKSSRNTRNLSSALVTVRGLCEMKKTEGEGKKELGKSSRLETLGDKRINETNTSL